MHSSKDHSISFVENNGQITDQFNNIRTDIKFKLATQDGVDIFLSGNAIYYQFSSCNSLPKRKLSDIYNHDQRTESVIFDITRLDVKLEGANDHPELITEEKQEYYENYFTSATPVNGITANTYKKITFKNIYPKIDWVFYINDGHLKHEFLVHAGGNAGAIKLTYSGMKDMKLLGNGSLIAYMSQGNITEQTPYCYAPNGKEVKSKFVLRNNVVGYDIGGYAGDLIIDPALVWATYYGGTGQDWSASVTTDATGNVYMSGGSLSVSNIATIGAYQTTLAGYEDCFIAKLNSSGIGQWATYYGGPFDEHVNSMAMDNSGNIYIVGITISTSGIATSGCFKDTLSSPGTYDAFIAKFNSAGLRQWGTYYGGELIDRAYAVAVDGSGNVYMGGESIGTINIATAGSYQPTSGGNYDGFLVKFDNTGTRIWCTYYGGTSDDAISSIKLDAADNIYLSGRTFSTNGIATPGAHQLVYGGDDSYWGDGFLVKFNSSCIRQWSTYYGGSSGDEAYDLLVDNTGNVYLTGVTTSTNGIATPGANRTTFGGNYDGFVVKFNNSGLRIWGTYFGGLYDDFTTNLAGDADGNVYVLGSAQSPGLSTPGAFKDTSSTTSGDAYLAVLNSTGVLQWAIYYGGGQEDYFSGICNDKHGNMYIVGTTASTTQIATTGVYQGLYGGVEDAFLVKINGIPASVVDPGNVEADINVTIYPNPANTHLTITTTEKINSINITNAIGQSFDGLAETSFGGYSMALDVAHLPAGVYFVWVNGVYVQKFVKE